jgi:hypothetical protein
VRALAAEHRDASWFVAEGRGFAEEFLEEGAAIGGEAADAISWRMPSS